MKNGNFKPIPLRIPKEAVSNYIYTVQIENGAAASMQYGPGCQEITGYHEHEFTRNPLLWVNMIAPEDRERAIEHARRVAAGEEAAAIEHQIVRKDGETRWVRNTPVLHRDERGTLLSYDGLLHDITDRKQAEENVKASEAKYRQLVELTQEGVWSIDKEENTTYVNPCMAAMLGYSVDEMLGRHLFTFMDEAGKGIAAKNLKPLRQGRVEIHDFELIGKSGQKIIARISANPIIGPDGAYQGALAIVIDITAHRKAERDYQTLFREMLNGFALHEMIYDTQGCPKDYRFLAVNPAFERMTSLKAEDIIGKTIREVMPNVEPHWIETYGKVTLTGKPACFENVSNTLGRVFDVTAFNPAPNQFACIFADITERKRAEDALQRESDRLNRVIETSPAGIVIMNQQGFITYANKQAESVLGLDQATISQRTYNAPDWHITDYAGNPFPDNKLPFSLIMATGHSVNDVRHAIKWPNGRRAFLTINAAPLFDKSGSINEIIATIEDITERKLTEELVQKSYRLYQQLIDHANDGIFCLDTNGVFLFVNKGICKMLGYTREEMRHINIVDTYSNETRNEGANRLAQIGLGKTVKFERIMKRKDGSFITIEADAWKNEEGHIQAIVRDITERKRAEEAREKLQEQLRLAQRMESIGQLAGGVAHDFNNMLAAIMMSVSLMETFPNLDPRVKQMLHEIQSDASRAANLIRQLLLFSRRSVMNMKLLDINEVVAGMLKMLGRLIGENICLQFSRNDGLPAVKADAGMIEQVIMNLIVNARDAMPKGGNISINIAAIEVSRERVQNGMEARPEQFICLSISDTGCGMDAETRERIFEPFFTTKEIGIGTGLGLATVYGIVAQHCGWVEVASEPGKGATFKIFLPSSHESILDSAQSETNAFLRGHETILFVEDAQNLREMMAQGLRSLGYFVIEAVDGQDALQKWQNYHHQIDMLFSDMVMPKGLTGLDLTERFLELKPNLKVIISSGYSAEIAENAKLSQKNIRFLQKPYGIGVMAKAIHDAFGKNNSF
jgi:two-component system, cell cycle sensor histidine kinase and response regulator CckA